jgi:eukaryotic-like serine/threonine-protein kinase
MDKLVPLGGYRILREAGRGQMAIVYEAESISLKSRVAVKVLPFAHAQDNRLVNAFINEARTMAMMHHVDIVPIYAFSCVGGVLFYAMKFIQGRSLAELISALQRGEYDFPTMTQWGIQAAKALFHIHQLGVVHRDIEPGNLLVESDNKLWITDFGLAQREDYPSLSMTGGTWGVLRYMSPELALREGLVDHRADIYSLGAVLYELLTLKPAIGGLDRQETLAQIAGKEPDPPREILSNVVDGLMIRRRSL